MNLCLGHDFIKLLKQKILLQHFPLSKNKQETGHKLYMWHGPNFMALLIAEFCAYDHQSLLTVQAPNFCASCIIEEYLVTQSTHAHKQKFPANP